MAAVVVDDEVVELGVPTGEHAKRSNPREYYVFWLQTLHISTQICAKLSQSTANFPEPPGPVGSLT